MIMYQNVIGIKKLITLFTRDCLRFAQQRIYYFPVPVMYLTEAVRRAQDILFPPKPRDAMPPCLSHATYGKRHELEDRLVRFNY